MAATDATSGARVLELTSREQLCNGVLDFEFALVGALEDAGIAEAGCFTAMQPVVERARNRMRDVEDEIARVGRVVLPLVQLLRSEASEPLRARIHYGATTQDALDTAWALTTREILGALSSVTAALMKRLATLANAARDDLIIARTNYRHAGVTSVGYRAACWLDSLLWEHERLREIREQALCVQYAGPVGTLMGLGEGGLQVRTALGRRLGLSVSRAGWHSARHRPALVAQWAGRVAMVVEQCAEEIWLRSSEDVGELELLLPAGHGFSSSLPHKRNPRSLEMAIAAVRRARDPCHRLSGDRAPGFERSGEVAVLEMEAWAELWPQLARALESLGSVLEATRAAKRWTLAELADRHPAVLSEAYVASRSAAGIGSERAYAEFPGESLRWYASDDTARSVTDASGVVRLDQDQLLAGANAQIDAVLSAWRSASGGKAGDG